MSIAALIRQMTAAGASAEAIAIAVEAIEAADARVEAGRAAARERKRRQREKDKAEDVTVTGQGRDGHGTVTAELPLSRPPSPQTPQPPTHTPAGTTTRARRAVRRCPEGWEPKRETHAKLIAEGFNAGDLERALTRMRDHEFKTPRSDWDATFRNWVRGDADRRPAPSSANVQRPDAKRTSREANYARAFAASGGLAGSG